MKARLFLSPLDEPIGVHRISEPTRLVDVFPDVEVMEWFSDGGVIRLNGHLIPPDRWHAVTLKPHPAAEIDFVYVPAGRKSFLLLASVALVALTAGIGTFGVPFLGAGFAAGTFGASAVAAGIGLAGSLAITALSAPPKVSNGSEQRDLSQAGVSGNTLSLLDVLPVIIGKIGASPPYLAPPYTTWDGNTLTAYAVVGVQGRCLVENVKINGLSIDDFGGAVYETSEGHAGDAARTLFRQTVIEERDNITFSNFITPMEAGKNDRLTDQANPDNSSPRWHSLKTAGKFTEVVLRLLFPSGIVDTSDGSEGIVPVRIEMRKVGSSTWRKLPTFHLVDARAGNGPFRCEIRLKRTYAPGGRHLSWTGLEYPIFSANNRTATGQAWQYDSDAYFATGETRVLGPSSPIPFFSSSAASSGFVWTASSNSSTAWQVADTTGASTYWSPSANTLPGAWLKLDTGTGMQIRSYYLGPNYSAFTTVPDHAPTKWRVEGSNDDVNWTQLGDEIDESANPQNAGVYHINVPVPYSYRYYRWVFLANNGAASGGLRIANLHPRTIPGVGTYLNQQPGGGQPSGEMHFNLTDTTSSCRYVNIDERGAEVWLEPDQWDEGEYEIRLKRGTAVSASQLRTDNTYYYGSVATTYFFEPQLVGGFWQVWVPQKYYRSDALIEAFQTIDADEEPFDGTGLALVAVAIPNAQISSIYAEFTRYASEWDGTIWSAEKVPTQNPAALYRDILLGEANAAPIPGEAIDEDGLADWFETCDANGYEANAMLQGARVGEAKQLIATAGYASPRDSSTYGVAEDRDTSAEPMRFLISPLNSIDEGTVQDLPILPDAIRAEFNNDAYSYAVDHVIVYRDGVDESTAKVFETISYPGFTNEAKVTARALFDLRQSQLRQVRYSRRVGIDAIALRRGSLVGLSDDVLDGDKAAGWVTAIEVDGGGDVLSITLDNIMPWGRSGDVEAIEDVSSITDIVNPAQPMGVEIRVPGSNALVKQVSNVSDSNVCTFVTPFPYAGSGLDVDLDEVGLLVVAGTWGSVSRRCKVISIVPQANRERIVVLADEAPGLFS